MSLSEPDPVKEAYRLLAVPKDASVQLRESVLYALIPLAQQGFGK